MTLNKTTAPVRKLTMRQIAIAADYQLVPFSRDDDLEEMAVQLTEDMGKSRAHWLHMLSARRSMTGGE